MKANNYIWIFHKYLTLCMTILWLYLCISNIINTPKSVRGERFRAYLWHYLIFTLIYWRRFHSISSHLLSKKMNEYLRNSNIAYLLSVRLVPRIDSYFNKFLITREIGSCFRCTDATGGMVVTLYVRNMELQIRNSVFFFRLKYLLDFYEIYYVMNAISARIYFPCSTEFN